jgi:hypothetical protein
MTTRLTISDELAEISYCTGEMKLETLMMGRERT